MPTAERETGMKDTLFRELDASYAGGFTFDREVVNVFDDMINRSVPFYEEIQRLIVTLALRWSRGRAVCDLGCSTGTTLDQLAQMSGEPLDLIGVDSSAAMLAQCQKKLEPYKDRVGLELFEADLGDMPILPRQDLGVVILSLVLQFIRPMRRGKILEAIFASLAPGGVLFLVEKTVDSDRTINAAFIDGYHAYKSSMGYDAMEIARKREALENKLIPFEQSENVELLRAAGFSSVSVFFSWLNFQGYVALKENPGNER